MRESFALPDLGEGIAEGELVDWHVEPGDEVTEDQVIAKVETDKALVDIPSPYEGEVVELHADVGEIVPVDTVLIEFEVDDGADASSTPTVEEDTADDGTESSRDHFAPPRVRRIARELDVDLATVTPSGDRISEADVRAAAGDELVDSTADPEPVARPSPSASGREQTLAVPATRRVAREHGVDIDAVPASEQRDGHPFVTQDDVEAYVADDAAATELDADGPGDRIPYTGVRRTIGDRMETAKFTAPHVSHHDEIEVGGLVEVRSRLKETAADRGVDLTYLPFAVKAVTAALQEVPAINAELDEEAEEILLHDSYHVGIAVATDAGLMVPVIEQADRKGLLDIASEINEKAARARDRSLPPDELGGSTFTITNFGAIGGEFASPIINYPEAAILGLGSLEKRPWVVDDEIVPRHTLPISLSSDHRIVDGIEAAQFTNAVKRYLHEPELLLLE